MPALTGFKNWLGQSPQMRQYDTMSSQATEEGKNILWSKFEEIDKELRNMLSDPATQPAVYKAIIMLAKLSHIDWK